MMSRVRDRGQKKTGETLGLLRLWCRLKSTQRESLQDPANFSTTYCLCQYKILHGGYKIFARFPFEVSEQKAVAKAFGFWRDWMTILARLGRSATLITMSC